jgi:glucosylceramidase
LLYELFSATEGIGISYLRLSIGASDLSDSVFTYNDMPPGKTDPQLKQFNMDMERVHLIPVLKEILAINPEIKIMGSPWSAPAWMKTNESAIGGSLRQEYFEAYSTYFVRYIEEMQKNNIHIDAITVQNEPLHPGNNPSMYMTAEQQAMFIKNNLGAGIKKKRI